MKSKLEKVLKNDALKQCLLYEMLRLQKITEWEDIGIEIFNDLFWGNYEVFYLVLNKLGIKENIYTNTDVYIDVYYQCWCHDEEITMTDVDDLIETVWEIYEDTQS